MLRVDLSTRTATLTKEAARALAICPVAEDILELWPGQKPAHKLLRQKLYNWTELQMNGVSK